jgi:hypothetical protein
MLDTRLPAAIPPPFYAQWRDLIFLLSLGVCLMIVSTKILYRPSAL